MKEDNDNDFNFYQKEVEKDSYGNDPRTYDSLDSRNYVDSDGEWIA